MTWQNVLEVFLIAIAFAFIYAWGYVKQQRKKQVLYNMLITRSEEKVLKELKKGEVLNQKKIEELINGTKASLFWSKDKIKITDPKIVAQNIIYNMISNGLIIEINGTKSYKLK